MKIKHLILSVGLGNVHEKGRDTADSLAKLTDDEYVFYEEEKKWFPPPDLEELTITGHTDDNLQSIGGQSPQELATFLSERLQNKTNLKHIYLVSCEAGLSAANQSSLAQRLAIELDKQGFKGLAVHAFAAPVEPSPYGMRVNVTTQKSKLKTKVAAPDEEIKVVVFQTQYDDRNNTNELTVCTAGKNYREILRQPEHTFTASAAEGEISFSVAHAVVVLKEARHKILLNKTRLDYDDNRVKELQSELDLHIQYLMQNPTDNLQEVIKKLHLKNDNGLWRERKKSLFNNEVDNSTYYDVIKTFVLPNLNPKPSPVLKSPARIVVVDVPVTSDKKATRTSKNKPDLVIADQKKSSGQTPDLVPKSNQSVEFENLDLFDQRLDILLNKTKDLKARLDKFDSSHGLEKDENGLVTTSTDIYTEKLQKKRERFSKALDAATTLYVDLFSAQSSLKKTGNVAQFKTDCNKAIAEAKKEPHLSTHRGWGRFLKNLALAVAMIGVVYFVAAVVHKKMTGKYTFFNQTNTEKAVEGVDKAYQSVDAPKK